MKYTPMGYLIHTPTIVNLKKNIRTFSVIIVISDFKSLNNKDIYYYYK